MAKWAPDDRAQLHRDANAALDQHMAPGERVRVIIRGPGSSAMIGTDWRVFIFKKGILFGRDLATFDYDDISGVAVHLGLVQGHVALQGPGLQTVGIGWGDKELHPDKVPHAIAVNEKDQARDGVTILRRVVEEFHSERKAGQSGVAVDIPDQIRKLGELREAGILTSQEFEAKKAELLARL